MRETHQPIASDVVHEVGGAAVRCERAGSYRRAIVRRQQNLLVRLQVVQVQIGVAARDEARDQRAVRRTLDVVDAAEPVVLDRNRGLARLRIVDPRVRRLRIALRGAEPVAAVRRERAREVVFLATAGDALDAGAVGLADEHLRVEAATARHVVRNRVRDRRPRDRADGIGSLRDLLWRADRPRRRPTTCGVPLRLLIIAIRLPSCEYTAPPVLGISAIALMRAASASGEGDDCA